MSAQIWDKVEMVAKVRNIPDTTFRSWKSRGEVPAKRRDELVEAAPKAGVSLTYEELKSIQ